MMIIGLTGSIGMGKTETAKIFARRGVPVFDADRGIHQLYGRGGIAVGPIEAAFPGTTVAGAVDRQKLGARVFGDGAALKRLEAILHPLVRRHQRRFLATHALRRTPIVLLDIPLLFESGGDARVDASVVVTAPGHLQRARVLARPGMSTEKFAAILGKQMPDDEKRRRANYQVDTGLGRRHASDTVGAILSDLRGRLPVAWPGTWSPLFGN